MVSRLAREVLVDLCGMSTCLFQVSGNAMCVMIAAGSWSVEELEELGIWVDEFGRWWSRSEVFPGRWVMHDTSNGPVRWDEPG